METSWEELTESRRETYQRLADELAVLKALPRVVKSRDVPILGGPQFWLQYVMMPSHGGRPTPLKSLATFIEYYAPGARSQKHGHQNEAVFYILEGRGYEIHDGERIDWEAGDIVMVPAGTVHQHFNADPDRPAKALVINPKPLYLFLNLIQQRQVETAPREPTVAWHPPGVQPARERVAKR